MGAPGPERTAETACGSLIIMTLKPADACALESLLRAPSNQRDPDFAPPLARVGASVDAYLLASQLAKEAPRVDLSSSADPV